MLPEEELGQLLKEKKLTISTAESCTGGLISSKLTDISGSSEYIKANYVTYSNDAKNKILGVSWDILNDFGAVSEQCAQAMVEGLHNITKSDIALCITGIAGPTGGTKDKPVGLAYISLLYNNIITVKKIVKPSNTPRIEMKQLFANEALNLTISMLKANRIA